MTGRIEDVLREALRAWIRHGEAVPADVTTYDRWIVHEELRALLAAHPAPPAAPEATEVAFQVATDWPTPNACRRAADAMDALTPARFGAILRAYADAEEARFDTHGPIRRVEVETTTTEGGAQ